MKRNCLAAALTLCLLPCAGLAQTGIPSEGRVIAVTICSECHSIERNGAASKNEAAPAFSAIAGMASATRLSLRVFLRSPHATMPNIILNDSELDAIIDYILGLRSN